jgi:hypothetical protein
MRRLRLRCKWTMGLSRPGDGGTSEPLWCLEVWRLPVRGGWLAESGGGRLGRVAPWEGVEAFCGTPCLCIMRCDSNHDGKESVGAQRAEKVRGNCETCAFYRYVNIGGSKYVECPSF